MIFKDLEITGGRVATLGSAAMGAGLLIDGRRVTLSDVSVASNAAVGGEGSPGLGGAYDKPGLPGSNGQDAQGAASTWRPAS